MEEEALLYPTTNLRRRQHDDGTAAGAVVLLPQTKNEQNIIAETNAWKRITCFTNYNNVFLVIFSLLMNIVLLLLVFVLWLERDPHSNAVSARFFCTNGGASGAVIGDADGNNVACSPSISSSANDNMIDTFTNTATITSSEMKNKTNSKTSMDAIAAMGGGASCYIRPNRIFGHLHMAKTGGTSVNGILANKYERVCGNKGYSYDAYQANEKALNQTGSVRPENNPRDRVRPPTWREIGFEDCDYISLETGWKAWNQFSDFHGIPMELHIPCRDRIDHLMSNCNFRHKQIDCDADDPDLFRAVQACHLNAKKKQSINRYSDNILNFENIQVKCYDFKKQFTSYMDYMSVYLQPRRLESKPYKLRETNLPRNKSEECIWSRPDVYHKVDQYLLSQYPYYSFCERCLGSENDITRE